VQWKQIELKPPYVEEKKVQFRIRRQISVQSKIFLFSTIKFVQKECVCEHLSNVILHKLNIRYHYVNIYVSLQTQEEKRKKKINTESDFVIITDT
jgi:hypothetical protein